MKRPLETLAADIADDRSVDWAELEGASQPGLAREFRIIAAIGAERERRIVSSEGSRTLQTLLAVAVAAATARVSVALLSVLATNSPRLGPRFLVAMLLASAGLWLLAGGSRDVRARALGILFLLASSPFVQAYLIRAQDGPVGAFALPFSWMAPEAFLPLALWAFVTAFPAPPRTLVHRRIGRWALTVSAGLGVTLATANLMVALAPTEARWFGALALQVFDRSQPQLLAWPVVQVAGLPGLVYLGWKVRRGTVDDRNKTALLAISVILGFAPVAAAVLLSAVVPGLAERGIQTVVGVGVYATLLALVPLTAYSVLAQRAVDVHLSFVPPPSMPSRAVLSG
jgi:hypothetical protein